MIFVGVSQSMSIALLLILIGDFVLDIEGTVWNFVEGCLNVLLVLSMFTLVFICIFPVRPMGACSFYLSCSSFLETRFLVCLCRF